MLSKNNQHLSPERIREYAYDNVILQPDELIHIKNCHKCSDAWWKLKLEARRKKQGGDGTEKSA